LAHGFFPSFLSGPMSTWVAKLREVEPPGSARRPGGCPQALPNGKAGVVVLPSIPQAQHSMGAEVRQRKVRNLRRFGATDGELPSKDTQSRADLRRELAKLRLSEFFDVRGTPKLPELGFSMASQHPFAKTLDSRAESRSTQEESPNQMYNKKGKGYLHAMEAFEKDKERWRLKATALGDVSETEKHRVEEVLRRQMEVLFSEVPHFEDHLPTGIQRSDLLPPVVSKDEELEHLQAAEASRSYFADTRWVVGSQMRWMLPRDDVLMLLKVCCLWMRAAHGAQSCLVGMDRPTFCRFILDLGLVDQTKVPFFWAVSLFDEVARWMPMSPVDHMSSYQPMVQAHCSSRPLASWWQLMSVLDTILRRHFTPAAAKMAFLPSLFPIARLKLPLYVLEESHLHEHSPGHMHDHSRDRGRDCPAGPGRARAAEDMQREELMRQRRIVSMTVEPEVLHIVTQHQALFRSLHECYADGRGTMSFADLLQFCLDFHLIPLMASVTMLKSIYEAVLSLEIETVDTLSPMRSFMPAEDQPSPPSPLPAATENRVARIEVSPERARASPERLRPAAADSPRAIKERSPMKGVKSHSPEAACRKGLLSELREWPGAPGTLPWAALSELAIETFRPGKGAKVVIEGARGLPVPERGSVKRFTDKSDPFCICQVVGRAAKFQTAAILGSQDPVWNHEAELIDYTRGDSIEFLVHDQDMGKKGTCLGRALLPRESLEFDHFEGELPLTGSGKQDARIRVRVSAKRSRPENAFPHGVEGGFGVGAFTEALCRVAFGFMESYGNAQQQIAGGLARAAWLMTFLRRTFSHLCKSLQKRLEPEVHRALRTALETIPMQLWTSPPLPEALRRGPAPVRRGLRLASAPTQHRLLQALDEDAPCVADSICAQCRREVLPDLWGNVRCPGCSAVDALDLRLHLFRPLLLDRHPSLRPSMPSVQLPTALERSDLTPPPLNRSDVLRESTAPWSHGTPVRSPTLRESDSSFPPAHPMQD